MIMFEKFRNKFPLEDSKWNEYTSYFNRLEVPAKTVLLEEGEISKKLFIIEKGCVRVWFNNNGKDLTTQFFFENQSVASIESFIKKIPARLLLKPLNLLFYGGFIKRISIKFSKKSKKSQN